MNVASGPIGYEIDASKCATCSYVIRGANKRTFCVLNHHTLGGEIPSNLTILGLEAEQEISRVMQERILLGMTHPHEENACSYHPLIARREEMKAFEESLQDWFDRPIGELGFTVNIANTLKAEGIDLKELINMGEKEFRKIPKMGPKFAMEVRQFLRKIGVEWRK